MTISGGEAAAGDVLRVNGGIDEPDCRLAIHGQLLVDERDIAGPHGRGKACAAIGVGGAGGLVGADVEREVGVGRNVRAVAVGGGTLVGGVDDAGKLLPGWNGEMVGADAAAAIDPGGFRTPGAAGARCHEVSAADGDDVGIFRRPGIVARIPCGAVAGGHEEVLALGGHLLKVGLKRGGIDGGPAPGTANGPCQRTVGGHCADDCCVGGSQHTR